ncbi:hypothetical protein H2198_000498 [Neophaeococcomyces mojaviensis]|uniref:Uncharacterized protein n=1 Tax=Neophaeococcomyces mojaviensis TaxID=3383035 RepID=A0ACC3AJU4_9EURO|nr:hypothetical protein H2198_000498 [Knufia sp. JES_112]
MTPTDPHPSITVFPHNRLNPISRDIYSGFLEHMGRCITGGIYDPQNPNKDLLIQPDNFRKDVIEALKPLDIPVFRYPGGNFTATYHWQDGVGPRSQRPTRLNIAWGGTPERNEFGTNEFMVWCREHMHAEPYLCLNMGTGSLDEGLAWIEYCNASVETGSYWAKLRAEHTGHDRPHNVKYWGLGNEVWGPWQIAQEIGPRTFAEKTMQWAKAIKLLDPTVKLILCGKDGISAWDYEVVKHCVVPATESDLGVTQPPLIDYVSIHMYTASNDYHENVFAPLAAERAIEATAALIDLACVENNVPPGQVRPKICFDEWNVWDPKRAVGSKGAEERYTLSDALAVVVWLNLFVRQSDVVGMACIAQSVNVISPLMTTQDSVIRQTTWWIYELFCRFVKGYQVNVVVGGVEEYQGSTKPAWLRDAMKGRMKWLDVSACVDEEGWCCLSVANLHKDEALDIDLVGMGKSVDVEVYTVSGEDVDVTNMDGQEKVKIVKKGWKAEGKYTFPKHSFTMLRWRM